MEKTREVVRRSMSCASTISAEEQQMALTEKEFSMIKKKMDKIDHHLNEMYKNWHAEYGNANTLEECKEIKTFINHIWKSMNPSIEYCTIYYNSQV